MFFHLNYCITSKSETRDPRAEFEVLYRNLGLGPGLRFVGHGFSGPNFAGMTRELSKSGTHLGNENLSGRNIGSVPTLGAPPHKTIN